MVERQHRAHDPGGCRVDPHHRAVVQRTLPGMPVLDGCVAPHGERDAGGSEPQQCVVIKVPEPLGTLLGAVADQLFRFRPPVAVGPLRRVLVVAGVLVEDLAQLVCAAGLAVLGAVRPLDGVHVVVPGDVHVAPEHDVIALDGVIRHNRPDGDRGSTPVGSLTILLNSPCGDDPERLRKERTDLGDAERLVVVIGV